MRLRIAHSPDADDAFMFYGISCGAVDPGPLDLVADQADIETLNRRAAGGDLDVTAISFAAWPRFAEAYDLLDVGSSFGLGYGPKVVAREAMSLAALAGRRVAIPGEQTTAALLLSLAVPAAQRETVAFEEIPRAVASGRVDAGVIIHEGQLTYEAAGLRLVEDLGAWWARETGGLPLPLGANAIRRGLPRDVVDAARRALRQSIEYALAHREEAVRHSLKPDRGLDLQGGSRYVAMYVNDLSLDPGPEGRAAVVELYARAARAGLMDLIEPRWC
jgi:1,4-dihydroxy-6-naphthoate synthase